MPSFLKKWLPASVEHWLSGFFTPTVVWTLTIVSGVSLLISLLAIPVFVKRLPVDYFTNDGAKEKSHSPARLPLAIVRNVLGLVLLILGLLMLILPGQGLLVILVALGLADFPKKRAIQKRIVRTGPIWRALNKLRERLGTPPLEQPS